MIHVKIAPTPDNGWASSFCTVCQEACPSDWPCECCMVGLFEWILADRDDAKETRDATY